MKKQNRPCRSSSRSNWGRPTSESQTRSFPFFRVLESTLSGRAIIVYPDGMFDSLEPRSKWLDDRHGPQDKIIHFSSAPVWARRLTEVVQVIQLSGTAQGPWIFLRSPRQRFGDTTWIYVWWQTTLRNRKRNQVRRQKWSDQRTGRKIKTVFIWKGVLFLLDI